ncbi:MAG: thermonuclease family protein [Mariprofundales bacterium]
MIRIQEVILVVISILLIIFFSIDAVADSKKHFGDLTVDKVISVYDGDTFRVNIKNLHPLLGDNISVRIAGMDTPEMKDKRHLVRELAKKAQMMLEERLNAGTHIELRNVKRGKYFRIIADVYIDDINIGNELIHLGLAKAYYGGKKQEWSNDDAIEATKRSSFFAWLREWWGKLF